MNSDATRIDYNLVGYDITEETDEGLRSMLASLEEYEAALLEGLSHYSVQIFNGISAYNEWRSRQNKILKRTRRSKSAIVQELAKRHRAQRRQAHEQTVNQRSPYYHFVELARRQMKPEEFEKAWNYATQQAQQAKG